MRPNFQIFKIRVSIFPPTFKKESVSNYQKIDYYFLRLLKKCLIIISYLTETKFLKGGKY